MLNHGANDGVFNLAVVQIDADFVADLEFAFWFLGCHAEECTSNHSQQATRAASR